MSTADSDAASDPLTVILIEDDTGLAELVSRSLRRALDVTVLRAETGADGIAAAKEHSTALLLIDYALPDMSAADVVAALRAQDAGPDFVVITGRGDEQVAVEMMKSGARDYVVKDGAFLDRLPVAVERVRQDITRDRQLSQQKELSTRVLAILNREHEINRLIADILQTIKSGTGVEAVGIRLREGDDYPYHETLGFPDTFVEAQRYLCTRDDVGNIIRDEHGDAVLEGICGDVIQGRTDPKQSFFTEHGSFWTGWLSDLGASIPASERQCLCIEGYESTALIPLSANGQTIGLIQLCDRRRDVFSLTWVEFLEGLSASIGIALQRQQAAETLRQSEAQYRHLVDTLNEGIWQIDAEGRTTYVNRRMAEMLGYTVDAMKDSHLFAYMDEEAVNEAKTNMQRRRQGITEQHEFRFRKKTGEAVHVLLSTSPLLDANGNYTGALAGVTDITQRKQAEADHEKLQAQLTQAQKMESVGRLAGGVAHDFNNLLMGIMNYAELCRDRTDQDHPAREWLDEITREAERSTNLTRQLLAFARKQTVTPRVLDINDAVGSMLKMLHRLIGEDIDLSWEPGAELWSVKIDPSQIDQILANLCVNARDAIGGVGKVTIETENVSIDAEYCKTHVYFTPGDYVMLAVSDDGCGMDHETLENIFEPFFTTKPAGKGTGLGLATVYGIVKQNDGFVNAYSELGEGTTFRIYLPREAEAKAETADSAMPADRQGGTKTILLVEDEKSIRVTVRLFLDRFGYNVIAAESPAEALRLADEQRDGIDLLLTDVVMPGMSGRELAEKLAVDFPTLKILYMSGYTADVIAHRGILEDGVNFISKPIGRDELARKVRAVLG